MGPSNIDLQVPGEIWSWFANHTDLLEIFSMPIEKLFSSDFLKAKVIKEEVQEYVEGFGTPNIVRYGKISPALTCSVVIVVLRKT